MATEPETPALDFGDLPLVLLDTTATIQPGDLCLDRDGGWLPFVGPIGDPVTNWIGDHIRQMARLRPEFYEAGWELKTLNIPIPADCQVLQKVGGDWVWTAPLVLGQMAYLVPAVIALRQQVVAQEGTRRIPLDTWMSAELQELIRTNVGDVLVRGLVRRNYHMIIPMTIFNTGDRDQIVQWLEEERARVAPPEQQITYVRVWESRRRDQRLNERLAAALNAPELRATRHEDEVIIEYVARIRHTQLDERMNRARFAVAVPRAIFNEGEERVERYCYDEYQDGNYDMIENVEEGEWEQVEEDFEIRQVNTTNFREIYQTINPPEPVPMEEVIPFEDAEQEAIDDNNN